MTLKKMKILMMIKEKQKTGLLVEKGVASQSKIPIVNDPYPEEPWSGTSSGELHKPGHLLQSRPRRLSVEVGTHLAATK
jgi:hypothetical protein